MCKHRRLRFKCGYPLGDVVALTAAVRDLHLAYPGQFITDVESAFPDVWANNPYITPLGFQGTVIDCEKVEVDRTGSGGGHYIEAYLRLINKRLGTSATVTELRGDIHLSDVQKSWYSEIWTFCGRELPYWIIGSGGKFDIPIKWWSEQRYQEVVNHFADKVLFVQVGAFGNHHPRLQGTVDLRGKTDVRDLILLMHHARGVLCGVTSLMHLAAAVPTRTGKPRPAVIVAGAREPGSWERYPHHVYLDTSKHVSCRACWLGTHAPRLLERRRRADVYCPKMSRDLPKCMDLIQTTAVIRAVQTCRPEGELKQSERGLARRAVRRSERENDFDLHNINHLNAVELAGRFLASIPPFPARRFHGRGIVMCAGGLRYFTNAWVCIKMLRQHGCQLPIQVWYLGRKELDATMEALLKPLGVSCVNARKVMDRYPLRNPLGWELKSYAMLHCSFKEILFLDADNVPVRDPEFLFHTEEFKRMGAIFWPDFGRLSPRRQIWKVCGVDFRHEPEFESGQMVVDKERCWRALNLAFWYNNHSEFFYRFIHGDKDTFHLAWRKVGQAYAMPSYPIKKLSGTMCQHDFEGSILFQHRNLKKWSFFGENDRVPGFLYERNCLGYIEELQRKWNGLVGGRRPSLKEDGFRFRLETADRAIFTEVVKNNEYRLTERIDFNAPVLDIGCHIGSFSFACAKRGARNVLAFEPEPDNFRLARENLRSCPGVRVRNLAVLDRVSAVEVIRHAPVGAEQNTGAVSVQVTRSNRGPYKSIALDPLLRKVQKVGLLKLDCEGCEWPVLLHSRELWRVQAVCGEYHEHQWHPLCPEITERLSQDLIERLLRRWFAHVRVAPSTADGRLGKFWAWGPCGGLNGRSGEDRRITCCAKVSCPFDHR